MVKLTQIVDLFSYITNIFVSHICIHFLPTCPISTSLADNPPQTGVMSSVTPGYEDTPLHGGLGVKPTLGNCKQGTKGEFPIVSSSSSMLEEPVWVNEELKEYNAK